MGTAGFSADILKGLLDAGFNIVGAVCQPDKEVGRKHELKACEVKQVCLERGIEVISPSRVRDDYQDVLAMDPDLIIACAYGQIIPKQLLDYPRFGCINTHASLLPKYRGSSPIQTAILNGEKITGMSLMYMNEKMDEGDIIAQEEIKISIEDTNTTMFERMSKVALKMLIEYIPRIYEGDIQARPQDHDQATYAPKLNKEIEHILFNDEVQKVYDHIRALLENPGCYFVMKGRKYKIEKAFYGESDSTDAGVFIGLEGDYLRLDCKDGFIKVYQIRPEGRNSMDARSFYNGVGRNMTGAGLE